MSLSFIDVRAVTTEGFVDPVAAPPGGNTPEYINIGVESQSKQGSLKLGTPDNSTFNYQLEVLGTGALLGHLTVENDLLVWENDTSSKRTLFVNATDSKVCISDCLDVGANLEVNNGGVLVRGGENYGTWGVSSDSEAIYGSGDNYGIYGLATGINNYGIKAVSTLSTAVEGWNSTNQYSSVAGLSDTGIGIYGSNLNPLGPWAGYFLGMVEASGDVSGAKLITTKLQNSLISGTIGQLSQTFDVANVFADNGNIDIKTFDGTNLWVAEDNYLYKVRPSDGIELFKVQLGNSSNEKITDVIFDGTKIWATISVSGINAVRKINPYSGGIECSTTNNTIYNPQGIAFDGLNYWVSASLSSGSGQVFKFNSNCAWVASYPVTLSDISLGKIIYDGTYFWAIATNSSTSAGYAIIINPSDGSSVRWDNLVGKNPADIFYDNHYYWVTNAGDGTVTQFYFLDVNICSSLDANDNPVVCSANNFCSSQGLGACFAVPQVFGTYSINPGHTINQPSNIIFDGSHLWINNLYDSSNSELVRMQVVDQFNIIRDVFPVTSPTTGMVFDGTNIWSTSPQSGLEKRFPGQGYGRTDLSRILALQNNSVLVQQSGSIDIADSASVGSDLKAGGNLEASSNIWGEGYYVIENSGNPLAPSQAHTCLNGYFITNIEVNGSNQLTKIECRSL